MIAGRLNSERANDATAYGCTGTCDPSMHPTTAGRNDDVRINRIDVLSDAWYTLRRVDFDYRNNDGSWQSGPSSDSSSCS